MIISDKLLKPLKETNYLNVENTDRYRPILRLFYMNYEKMKYWLSQEDVYDELKEDPHFAGYTIEQCGQDLSVLVSWGNLTAIQDTKRAVSLEEFKNRKFQYQMSEYAVEIERMVIHLENLSVEGASLEPGLLERIYIHLERMGEVCRQSDEKVYGFWNDLMNDFSRLNQNYQDYMRTLNSARAEELMQTKEFLVFKDHLVEYLRNFVKGLQENVIRIEEYLKNLEEAQWRELLERVIRYDLSIPRMDVEVREEQIREKLEGRWTSMVEWFVSQNGKEAEAGRVFNATNEIIRKITRYAARISELSNLGANRREEYYKVAKMFRQCADIREAHRLSANVFGTETVLHIRGDFPRETDSINSGVYDEQPGTVVLRPRTRTYREKAVRTGIVDRTKEKEEMRKAAVARMEEEKRLLDSYIEENCLEFSRLPVLEPFVRDIFLTWLSKALERRDFTSQTEDGRMYTVERAGDGFCTLRCTDGDFIMPAYRIKFKEKVR